MTMDYKWNGGSLHFSFQVVTPKTNQTRGYCSRKFKVDRSKIHPAKRNVLSEVSTTTLNFIVKSTVETAVVQAAG